MSTFSTSETLQTSNRWFHFPKRHDTSHYPSLYQSSRELQEGQLYNAPLRDKTSSVLNLSLPLDPQKDKAQLDSESGQCGHTSIGCEASTTNPFMITQGCNIPQLNTGLGKEKLTFRSDVFNSEDQWPGLGNNAFEGTLHASEPESSYSDFLGKPTKYGQVQQISNLLTINNYEGVQLSTEASVDLKQQENESFDNIHGNTVASKSVNGVIDKKEMRARRNRESARRSRMKSKQHFQRMEQTFVLMNRENRTLLAVVEKLLPNYIGKFPQLRGKLQSLFGIGR